MASHGLPIRKNGIVYIGLSRSTHIHTRHRVSIFRFSGNKRPVCGAHIVCVHASQCVTVIKICPRAFIYLLPRIYTIFESHNKLTNLSFAFGFFGWTTSRSHRSVVCAEAECRQTNTQTHVFRPDNPISWARALRGISFMADCANICKTAGLTHRNYLNRGENGVCCMSFSGSMKIITMQSNWKPFVRIPIQESPTKKMQEMPIVRNLVVTFALTPVAADKWKKWKIVIFFPFNC